MLKASNATLVVLLIFDVPRFGRRPPLRTRRIVRFASFLGRRICREKRRSRPAPDGHQSSALSGATVAAATRFFLIQVKPMRGAVFNPTRHLFHLLLIEIKARLALSLDCLGSMQHASSAAGVNRWP